MIENKELRAGSTLSGGRYTIESVIGSGGFGITYKARHTGLGWVCAVKEFFISEWCVRNTADHTVHLQGISTEIYEKYRRAFEDEARTLAQLNHPNVVKVTDIFSENNTSYLVMPFVQGLTLKQTVEARGRLDYETAVNYIAQIAEATGYVHSLNILHRDIKPDNIIITPDNKAILIDFGSAREFINDKTQHHTAMLTPGYAPLEQYSPEGRRGSYTDIYALGAVFYFALTGRKPMDAATRSLGLETMPEPKTLAAGIPEAANRTIVKAMSMKPTERHQTAGEFMRNLLGGTPQKPQKQPEPPKPPVPPTPTPDGGKPSKSRRFALLSSIAAVIAIAVIAFFLLGGKTHPAEPEMVYVQGGTFTMGCTSEQGSDCENDESPAHRVTVSSFKISKYEVTQKQWQLIMGTTIAQQRDLANKDWPLRGEGDNYPMYYVSWEEAQEFCKRLNAATGKKYRLPTEAEWEYAARGVNNSNGYKYSGSDNIDRVAWYDEGNGSTHPVGTKSPNELGIYDMSGNVWEWCSDWYGTYSSSAQTNPKGAYTGSYRVCRGGSWRSIAGRCRVAPRGIVTPGIRDCDLGFRLVLP